jgi:hypothetical protein
MKMKYNFKAGTSFAKGLSGKSDTLTMTTINHRCQVSRIKRVTHASASFLTLTRFSLIISRISRKLAEKLKCREIMMIVKCLN